MTTYNIEGLDALIEASEVVSRSVTRRRDELTDAERREAEIKTRKLRDMAIAANATRRHYADASAKRQEELAQLNEILDITIEPTLPPPAAPETVTTTVTTEEVHEPEPPAPAATTTTTETTRVERINHANPRNWGLIAWAFAIVGALIALLIARETWQWAVELITGETYRGDWRSFLKAVWYVLVIGFGFFCGGFIGSLIIKPFVDGFRNGSHRARVTRFTTRRRQDPPRAA